MHLRPSDFFLANPAIDVPSSRNQTSVLVPCCGGGGGSGSKAQMARSGEGKSVQDEPTTHMQGSGSGIDAQQAGAKVEGK